MLKPPRGSILRCQATAEVSRSQGLRGVGLVDSGKDKFHEAWGLGEENITAGSG